MSNGQNTGRGFIPKFFTYNGSTEWRPNVAYSAKTIVTRNFKVYTSIVNVPSNVGAPEDNPKYWQAAVITDEVMQTIIDELGKLDGDVGGLEGRIEIVENEVGELEVAIGEAQDEIEQLKNALTTKAEQDGAYSDLTAGQILSKNETSDSVPYNFRAVGHDATLEYTDAIVGGSVVRNQLVQNGNFTSGVTGWIESNASLTMADNIGTVTAAGSRGGIANITLFPSVANNHKYLATVQVKLTTASTEIRLRLNGGYKHQYTISTTDWQTVACLYNYATVDNRDIQVQDTRSSGWDAFKVKNFMLIDLTQMFGTAIADYVYTLETATSGAGVAWLRKHFPKIFDAYQEYNAGEIVSVQGLSQHVTVGFNQFDKDTMVISGSYIESEDGSVIENASYKRTDYIRIVGGEEYYIKTDQLQGTWGAWYDADKNYISPCQYYAITPLQTAPANACYVRLTIQTSQSGNPDTFRINLSDPTRNGEYEPYQKHTYPLDSTKTFRGIFKLDSNNNLYADGDRYLPDGTVQRRYGERAYQSGDVTDGSTMITDGTNTVYKLTTTTTEEADPYTVPQIVDPDGTEEFVSTSIVPVGHESRYPLDIAGRLDKILTMPTANGTYTLRATVNNGAVTYAWVST